MEVQFISPAQGESRFSSGRVLRKERIITLTLKRQSRLQQTTLINIFFHCFSEKIRLDVPSESSARQGIHMKNQALFSSKDKSKKIKCHLLQFLFGALRVKLQFQAGARFTKHLKPKNFVSSIQFVWNLRNSYRLKIFSETGTRVVPLQF